MLLTTETTHWQKPGTTGRGQAHTLTLAVSFCVLYLQLSAVQSSAIEVVQGILSISDVFKRAWGLRKGTYRLLEDSLPCDNHLDLR